MKSRKTGSGKFAGKGYYIALILCAAAIGITGYLYYRNENKPEPQAQLPTLGTQDKDVQAVATQPVQQDQNTLKPTESEAPTAPLKTALPVEGNKVADYAMDCLSYNPTTRDWRVHDGIDIAAAAGTPVCAAAEGTVYTVYTDDTMGTTVVICHPGGYVTRYASLAAEVSVKPGETVMLGQTIGAVGCTALLESAIGEHVHFSVTCKDAPVDPSVFLGLE